MKTASLHRPWTQGTHFTSLDFNFPIGKMSQFMSRGPSSFDTSGFLYCHIRCSLQPLVVSDILRLKETGPERCRHLPRIMPSQQVAHTIPGSQKLPL